MSDKNAETGQEITLPEGLTILVLDDNEGFLEILDQFFGDCGYRCFLTATVPEARKILEEEEVSVALLDYALSKGETSTELFHEIRRRWPSTKVFLVSGFLQFHELNEFLIDKLTDQILLKPFSLAQLRMAIHTVYYGKAGKLDTDPGQAVVPG